MIRLIILLLTLHLTQLTAKYGEHCSLDTDCEPKFEECKDFADPAGSGRRIFQCVCKNPGTIKGQNGICQDKNECERNEHTCNPVNQICVNKDLSYDCVCKSGFNDFKIGERTICQDKNECNYKETCGKPHRLTKKFCENTQGSFECKCGEGFETDLDTGKCLDVDECDESPCSPAATCINTESSIFLKRKIQRNFLTRNSFKLSAPLATTFADAQSAINLPTPQTRTPSVST